MDNIILFDGLCNFCDHSVQFIIKRDHAELYKFASLQSDIGQKLLEQYDIPHDTDSFVLLTKGSWYSKSTAALHVARHLNGLTKMRSEEHTSELQSRGHLVCRLLLEEKK